MSHLILVTMASKHAYNRLWADHYPIRVYAKTSLIRVTVWREGAPCFELIEGPRHHGTRSAWR